MELQEHLEGYRSRGVTVVGVSVDSAKNSRILARKLGVTFPLLVDDNLTAIRAWGVLDAENDFAWPAVFLVDRSGKIVWRELSENYRKRPASEAMFERIDALGK